MARRGHIRRASHDGQKQRPILPRGEWDVWTLRLPGARSCQEARCKRLDLTGVPTAARGVYTRTAPR